MNYGYPCEGWTRTKKIKLAERINAKLDIAVGRHCEPDPDKPYIEIDDAYKGVRIRRLTHLNPDKLRKVVETADAIHYDLTKEVNK